MLIAVTRAISSDPGRSLCNSRSPMSFRLCDFYSGTVMTVATAITLKYPPISATGKWSVIDLAKAVSLGRLLDLTHCLWFTLELLGQTTRQMRYVPFHKYCIFTCSSSPN